ncbi:MAG: SulP family inorganic anion transporter [Caldilineaceae bacterium]
MAAKIKPQRGGIVTQAISGLATGLFNVPSGLAYAQLAGVNPIFGLYSGIFATLVAALSTGTLLMISTITSAIALTTGSVLQAAGIQSSQMPQALFTLTFLAGAIMLVLGLLRLGSIVNFISNAVMTGFVGGMALLIILGQEQHLTGYSPAGANQLQKTADWLQNFAQWDMTTLGVGIAVIVLMVILQRIRPIARFASILTLLAATVTVDLLNIPTELVGGIAAIPSGLPTFSLPDFSLAPQLAQGALAVAFVALAQGAAVSVALPNPDGSKSDSSRDFVGEGLGNLAGSFFQCMGTGGALSQSAVNAEAGATSRLSGIFAAAWMALIVLLFGSYVEQVPLSVIGGMLVVIGVELILARMPSARLVFRTGQRSAIAAMLLTFLLALFVPLQDTILFGALLSLLLYVGASAHKLRLQEAVRLDDGGWEMREAPPEIKAGQATVIVISGLDFFAEVPALDQQMPPARGVEDAAVVLILRDMSAISSTTINWLLRYGKALQANGSVLMLADVNPAVEDRLRKSGALDVLGAANVFSATARVLDAENQAWDAAQAWLRGQDALK